MIFINIIVLIFEILYYSMFMKFARKEGKFWKYLLLFTLVTISGLFIPTNTLLSYLYLILAILFGLKYIIKLKTSLYDMFFILIMIFFKLIIEYVSVFSTFFFFGKIISTIFMMICKIAVLFIVRKQIKITYNKLKRLWYKNNFYIRYIFSCLMYVYVIITIISLINF